VGLFAIAALLLAPGTLCATPLAFAAEYSAPARFGIVDVVTGQFDLIATLEHTVNDIGLSPGGVLYGIIDDCTQFVRIDAATGALTIIGPLNVGVESLVFSPGGILYAATQNALYLMNPSNAALTLVGGYGGLTSGQNIRFASDGQLYTTDTSSNTSLYRIDASSGLATLVGSTGYPGLALGYAGHQLYGVGMSVIGGLGNLVRIDPTTGKGTVVLDDFPEVGFTELPEPSAAWLCALGLAGVVVLASARYNSRVWVRELFPWATNPKPRLSPLKAPSSLSSCWPRLSRKPGEM
jgi:hypothetical protein